MPEPSDKYKPTEADLDLVIEEATGKPMKPTDLATGVASLHQRLKELEAEKSRLLDRLDSKVGEREMALNKDLADINKDLAATRERISYYEAQLGRQN